MERYLSFVICCLFFIICFTGCHGYKGKERRSPNDTEYSNDEAIQQLNAKVQELLTIASSLETKTAEIGSLQALSLQHEAEIKALSAQLQTIGTVSTTNSGSGAVFTRWGRSTCPTNITDTIYSGYMAGGHYTHGGSITNYLCLPNDPEQNNTRSATLAGGLVSFIYGVEFESNFWKTHSQNQDVPCAVCRSTASSTQLMIPGRNSCYPGWTAMYDGYLGSEYYAHAGNKEGICVDSNPDYLPGGAANKDGGLLYPVVSKCGSLECPPYEDNTAVTCVVCVN